MQCFRQPERFKNLRKISPIPIMPRLFLRVTESKSLEYFIKICFTDDSDTHQKLRTTGLGSALEPEVWTKLTTLKQTFTLSCGNSLIKGEESMG